MITREISFICSICGESVDVIACVMDESSKPMHKLCYASKRVLEDARKTFDISQGAMSEQLRSPSPGRRAKKSFTGHGERIVGEM